MQVRVIGPECGPLSPSDMRRLFRGQRLSAARRERLAEAGRVVASRGSRCVGVAAYERAEGELRVHEFGIDTASTCSIDEIANAVIDALEVACLASGARRVLLLPRAALAATTLLIRRGYLVIAEGCAGTWFEKTLA
jgi:hypothetical protein